VKLAAFLVRSDVLDHFGFQPQIQGLQKVAKLLSIGNPNPTNAAAVLRRVFRIDQVRIANDHDSA